MLLPFLIWIKSTSGMSRIKGILSRVKKKNTKPGGENCNLHLPNLDLCLQHGSAIREPSALLLGHFGMAKNLHESFIEEK